jgi:hypothetical protein
MGQGIVRWYVPDDMSVEAEGLLRDKAVALGLSPQSWSSRTFILTFSDDPSIARARFNDLQAWLSSYFHGSGQRFRAICSGADAFCSF